MTRSQVLGCVLVVVTLVGLVASPAAAAGPGGLSVRVDTLKSFVGRGERPVVEVTLTNQGAADVYLVRWQTPFAGVRANLFEVQRDGEPVQYLGALVKHGQPRAEDYVMIPAGGSRSVRVDLGRYYDVLRSGEYSVRYRVSLQDALRDARPTAIDSLAELASPAALLAIDRDDSAARMLEQARAEQARIIEKAGGNTFVGCSSTRQSSISSARSGAGSYASGASSYLGSHSSTSVTARYTTWFGSATSSRYSSVKTHYSNEVSVFANAAMTFDCSTCPAGPDASAYAYVYSNQPYRVYLCNAFWSAPSTGTDSKAGTLVHETSHFDVVAGTNDWAYGQTACKSLAKKNANHAVDNADSHEYFAENSPSQN